MGFEYLVLLKIDYRVDLVLFDSHTVRNMATYAKPLQYLAGVLAVMVNGVWVVRDGACTAQLPGRFVRKV